MSVKTALGRAGPQNYVRTGEHYVGRGTFCQLLGGPGSGWVLVILHRGHYCGLQAIFVLLVCFIWLAERFSKNFGLCLDIFIGTKKSKSAVCLEIWRVWQHKRGGVATGSLLESHGPAVPCSSLSITMPSTWVSLSPRGIWFLK